MLAGYGSNVNIDLGYGRSWIGWFPIHLHQRLLPAIHQFSEPE